MEPSLFADSVFSGADEAAEQRALVALSLVPGVGPGRIRALLARFGSAAAVLAASVRQLKEVPGLGPQTAAAIARFEAEAEVEAQFRCAEAQEAVLLASWDAHFPEWLRQIYDPPAFLWMRGDVLPVDDQALAIVGTRRPSAYGKQVAYDLAFALAKRGFTIVSGLAYGIDAAAHRGALAAGGRTLAILGAGVDRIYPSRHTRLAHDILAAGALLSEYPMGAAPDAVNFPRRNRIVSGLAMGTVVVEAFEKGGALITARLALEQNREVFAVPSNLNNEAGRGTNRLIRDGHAKLILGVEDILAELDLPESAPASEAPVAPQPPADLNAVEQQLYDALTAEPIHLDTLCERTGLDASSALVYLLSLEFKGLVRQLAGKQFFRV